MPVEPRPRPAAEAPKENPATHRPRGFKLADEEMEHLEEKRAAGDVLDPIALDDPVGAGVEKTIMRVGITVVAVLVAGILMAQVACKNLQLMSIPDFHNGVTAASVERALANGTVWGGEVVRFPGAEEPLYVQDGDAVYVTVTTDAARTLEQLVSTSQDQATALAMNLLRDEGLNCVVYTVRAPVNVETGAFQASADLATAAEVLRIAWVRDSHTGELACTMSGYNPLAATVAE